MIATGDAVSQIAPGSSVILLVDPDVEGLHRAQNFLEEHGHTVLDARTVFDAILVYARRPDLVELVLVNPESGNNWRADLDALLRILRPSIRVMLLADTPPASEETLGGRDGRVLFLRKPFSDAELARQVAAALGRGDTAATREGKAGGDGR